MVRSAVIRPVCLSPNERGYCGPDDHRALLEYRTAGRTDGGLAQLAKAFTGPWPYLKLMAEKTGMGDPFHHKFVEAYWVGNELLDRIGTLDFGNTVEDKFRHRVGSKWPGMAEAIPSGIPHHSFHVFVTYPWVGLLTESHRGEPLHILDQCRIRWGQVTSVQGDQAIVRSRPSLGMGSSSRWPSPGWSRRRFRSGDWDSLKHYNPVSGSRFTGPGSVIASIPPNCTRSAPTRPVSWR